MDSHGLLQSSQHYLAKHWKQASQAEASRVRDRLEGTNAAVLRDLDAEHLRKLPDLIHLTRWKRTTEWVADCFEVLQRITEVGHGEAAAEAVV